jgi:hypothetical protein
MVVGKGHKSQEEHWQLHFSYLLLEADLRGAGARKARGGGRQG